MTRSAIGVVVLCAAMALSAAMPSGRSCCVDGQCYCPTRQCTRGARQKLAATPTKQADAGCRCCPKPIRPPARPTEAEGREGCPYTNCPLLRGAHHDRFSPDPQVEIRLEEHHGDAAIPEICLAGSDPVFPVAWAAPLADRYPPWTGGGLVALHCSLWL